MAEPKKKLSATRSGNRRSHLSLKRVSVAQCAQCNATVSPHTVCLKCGYYKGQRVISQRPSVKQS